MTTTTSVPEEVLTACPPWCRFSDGDVDWHYDPPKTGEPRHWCSVGVVEDADGCALEVTISVGASWLATDQPTIKVRTRDGEALVSSSLARSLAAMLVRAADHVEQESMR